MKILHRMPPSRHQAWFFLKFLLWSRIIRDIVPTHDNGNVRLGFFILTGFNHVECKGAT